MAKTPKGAVRVYELRLPKDYQPTRAYPLIFEDHGCDGSIPISFWVIAHVKHLVSFQMHGRECASENFRVGFVRAEFAGNEYMGKIF